MVKGIITVVLALCMLFSFAACGNDNNNTGTNDGTTNGAQTKGMNDYDILDNNGITGNGGVMDNNSTNDIINSTDMGSR